MRVTDLLRRSTEIYPDKTAVAVVGGPSVTYAELSDRVRRLAGGLRSAGVRHGDRVLIMARNGLGFFDVYLAASWLGAAAVPVNTRLAPPEIDYIVTHSDPAFAFADEEFVTSVERSMPAERPVVAVGSDAYRALLAGDPCGDEEAAEADTALIIYTSGTTGTPKGVCLTQRGLTFNALVSAVGQNFVPSDVFLSVTPLYHAATGTRVYTMLVDGQTHVVLPHFDDALCLDAIRDHGVTTTIVVPVQLRRLIDSPAFAEADLTSLRLVIYGAAPTDLELIERARSAFACGLHQGYGLSEAVTNLTALTPDDHRLAISRPELLASCGRVTPGVAIELRDDSGAVVAADEIGEIWVRTDKVMSGYWRNDEETAKAIVDGWLRTGDLARRDEDGYLFIAGRAKDMLISGGVNIYPMEIEAVLYTHPSVVDAGVIGVSDAEWGEVPVAFVTIASRTSFDESELRGFCEARLARIKVPTRFVVIDEFPRTETGKIKKRELRVTPAAAAS